MLGEEESDIPVELDNEEMARKQRDVNEKDVSNAPGSTRIEEDKALDGTRRATSDRLSNNALDIEASPKVATRPAVSEPCHRTLMLGPKVNVEDPSDHLRAESALSEYYVQSNLGNETPCSSSHSAQPYTSPRSCSAESDAKLRDWFRAYQSDEETPSEDNQTGYDIGEPK